jgi:hypothetical protein
MTSSIPSVTDWQKYIKLERFSSRLNRKGIPIGRDF